MNLRAIIFLLGFIPFIACANNIQEQLELGIELHDVQKVEQAITDGAHLDEEVVRHVLNEVKSWQTKLFGAKWVCGFGGIASVAGLAWSGFKAWYAWQDLQFLSEKLFPWYKNVINRKPMRASQQSGYYFAMSALRNPQHDDPDAEKPPIPRLVLDNIKEIYAYLRPEPDIPHKPISGFRQEQFKQWFPKLHGHNYFGGNKVYYEHDITGPRPAGMRGLHHQPQLQPFIKDPYHSHGTSGYENDEHMLRENERLADEYFGQQYSLRGGTQTSDFFNVLDYVINPNDIHEIDTWLLLKTMLQKPFGVGLASILVGFGSYKCYQRIKHKYESACAVAKHILAQQRVNVTQEIKAEYEGVLSYLLQN